MDGLDHLLNVVQDGLVHHAHFIDQDHAGIADRFCISRLEIDGRRIFFGEVVGDSERRMRCPALLAEAVQRYRLMLCPGRFCLTI
ncbi:hypothetical protein L596_001961 [Steinernema carpocapsae]|uniref:Uncharacterized protein n=1 Tax=Steinernema carpocapsae TaxID=34508 RepID=A0A4U8UNS6_STECR|nr:hypothetical protein L596_001961 [Steinernema carpocapsae]